MAVEFRQVAGPVARPNYDKTLVGHVTQWPQLSYGKKTISMAVQFRQVADPVAGPNYGLSDISDKTSTRPLELFSVVG